jgi:hypothetical protein
MVFMNLAKESIRSINILPFHSYMVLFHHSLLHLSCVVKGSDDVLQKHLILKQYEANKDDRDADEALDGVLK